jgi:hypothetical protein
LGTGNKSVLSSGISIAKLDFLRPESPIFYIKFQWVAQKIERSINLSGTPYFVGSQFELNNLMVDCNFA